MKTVNTLVEKIYKEAKHKMVGKQANDQGAYKELIKNLIVQVCQIVPYIFGYGCQGYSLYIYLNYRIIKHI